MTERRSFKRRVRERMSKTGESYTAARSAVDRKRERKVAARVRLAQADEILAESRLREATGKGWDQWFAILDRWGARKRKHPEIARFLMEERGVPGWYAQSITVGYERARGMRLKHQQGTGFSVSASKTIAVPLEVLYEAIVDDAQRRRWLREATVSLRTSQPRRSARYDWEDGPTRVIFSFEAKGASKSTIHVEHAKLPDADDAETMKATWRERLAELKQLLEG
jgi:uncharacterized protein YndB with AHSA1/START domain